MNRTVLVIGACFVILLAAVFFAQTRRHAGDRVLLTKPPSHGVSFVCELDAATAAANTNLMSEFQEAVKKRFAGHEKRIYFERVSATRMRIVVGTLDAHGMFEAKNLLTKPGLLQFRFVHDDSEKLLEGNVVPIGYEVLSHDVEGGGRPGRAEKVLVRIRADPGLSGDLIQRASVSRDNAGRPQIMIRLNPEAAAAFATTTRENVGRRLAIVVDGKLMTAPRINSPIEGGSAVIEGNYSATEASDLARALEAPLPVQATILEANSY